MSVVVKPDHVTLTDESLLVKYAFLVKKISSHLMARLPPNVCEDDLIQVGMLGLLNAAKNYKSEHGASFETYASIRIRGAMLDEIRRYDHIPRSIRQKSKSICEAAALLGNKLGREPTNVQVANHLSMKLEDYYYYLTFVDEQAGIPFHEIWSHEEQNCSDKVLGSSNNTLEEIQKQDTIHSIANKLKKLPDKQRMVVTLYYEQELNLKEIGQVLGISESRCCQLLNQAVKSLRHYFDNSSQI